MEVKGKIIAKPASVSGVSAKGPWRKSSIIVQYEEGQYPKQLLLMSINKDEALEKLQIGQTGTFKFDGNVRQASNGNYYLDLNVWGWDLDAQQTATEPAPAAATDPADLPF